MRKNLGWHFARRPGAEARLNRRALFVRLKPHAPSEKATIGFSGSKKPPEGGFGFGRQRSEGRIYCEAESLAGVAALGGQILAMAESFWAK